MAAEIKYLKEKDKGFDKLKKAWFGAEESAQNKFATELRTEIPKFLHA